jgi:hypothetical protein
VRRPFYEIAAGGAAPIAGEALARIAALYAIEAAIRGRSADDRRAVRQEKTRPLVDSLKRWLEAQLSAVSQKSTIAEAIRYALTRWSGLARFLDDGRVEIDSNVVERAIRPLALNRKNALFAGSDALRRDHRRHRVRRSALSFGRTGVCGLPQGLRHGALTETVDRGNRGVVVTVSSPANC